MKDAIETLLKRKKLLQQMIDANIGERIDSERKVTAEAKQRLSEVEAALNLISTNVLVSGNEANPKKLQSGEVALPTAIEIYSNVVSKNMQDFTDWWDKIRVGNDR